MIDRSHALSIVRQAKVLDISRGSVYYKPRPVSAEDLALTRRIDDMSARTLDKFVRARRALSEVRRRCIA
jgi:hypothetical protein